VFQYWNYEIKVKNPSEPMLRRMLAMAAALDAWVDGDDPMHFYVDEAGNIVEREPPLEMIHEDLGYFIARGASGVLERSVALPAEEWLQLVDQESDFRMSDDVEARLPGGRRRISSPRHAEWLGHPSGRAIPFFYEDGAIEVKSADQPTIDRMLELADALGATVMDGGDVPVRGPRTMTRMIGVAAYRSGRTSTPGTQGLRGATVEQLSWLAGEWHGEQHGRPLRESWTSPFCGTMMGTHSRGGGRGARLYAVMTIEPVGATIEMRIKHFGEGLIGMEERAETVRFILVDLCETPGHVPSA
jgi:hypothetical protein